MPHFKFQLKSIKLFKMKSSSKLITEKSVFQIGQRGARTHSIIKYFTYTATLFDQTTNYFIQKISNLL